MSEVFGTDGTRGNALTHPPLIGEGPAKMSAAAMTWRDDVQLVPQALVNIPLVNKDLLKHPAVQEFIDKQSELYGSEGRILIRPSGTEPKVRIMIEAPNAQEAAQSAAVQFQELLSKIAA